MSNLSIIGIILILILITIIVVSIVYFTKRDAKVDDDDEDVPEKETVVLYNPLTWIPRKYNPFWSYPSSPPPTQNQQQQIVVNLPSEPSTTEPAIALASGEAPASGEPAPTQLISGQVASAAEAVETKLQPVQEDKPVPAMPVPAPKPKTMGTNIEEFYSKKRM